MYVGNNNYGFNKNTPKRNYTYAYFTLYNLTSTNSELTWNK